MWFLRENCRGVKIVTGLHLSQGIVRTSVLLSLWAFPLPTAWLLQRQGDAPSASSGSNVPPLQPSLHWRPSMATPSLCVSLSPRRQGRCFSSPWSPELPLSQGQNFSFRKHALFLAAIFPKAFFFFFTLSISSNILLGFIYIISTDTQKVWGE